MEDLEVAAQEAYAAIYKPLEDRLIDKKALYVVPEDMLYLLPYDAMMDDEGEFLIKRQGVRILSSSRDLVDKKAPARSEEMVILAGPDYFVENEPNRPSSGHRGALSVSSEGLRSLSFDPLDGAEAEGKTIKENYTGKTSMWIKKDAEERKIHQLKAPKMLHIATHGFFLAPEQRLKKRLLSMQRGGNMSVPPPADNPLFRAGLAFAGVNANAPYLGEINGDNDGVLTAMEVLDIDLYGACAAG